MSLENNDVEFSCVFSCINTAMNSRLIIYTFLVLTIVACTSGTCTDDAGLACPHGCCGSIRYKQVCCPDSSISVGLSTGEIVAIVCAVLFFPITIAVGIACCRGFCRRSSPIKRPQLIETNLQAMMNKAFPIETDDSGYPVRPSLGARQFRPPSTASATYSTSIDNSSTFQPLSVPQQSLDECTAMDGTTQKGPMITTV